MIRPLARAKQSMLNYLNQGISDDAATLSKAMAEQEWEQAHAAGKSVARRSDHDCLADITAKHATQGKYSNWIERQTPCRPHCVQKCRMAGDGIPTADDPENRNPCTSTCEIITTEGDYPDHQADAIRPKRPKL